MEEYIYPDRKRIPESIYDKLKEKYEDVYLIRNEKDVRIYSFVGGNTFEPDFLLFLKKKDEVEVYDNIPFGDCHFSLKVEKLFLIRHYRESLDYNENIHL